MKCLTPFISGGGTVLDVTKETLKFKEDHEKFEGGTPNIADVVAFSSAIDYLNKINIDKIKKYEEELTKYACNTYLASQVVLTNVFANIAKKSGANWRDMAPAILADERIGRFVHPGIGFGGSCFRKDVSQLYNTSREKGNANEDSAVLQAILEQNEKQKKEIIYSLEKRYGKDFSGKIFAVWGLSFKKDTNDIRD
ncbi:MAG: UDP-glucose 6-dehydrogenase tuaD, partial [Parcubacteria group bacterium GW2011_GWF1_52_5]